MGADYCPRCGGTLILESDWWGEYLDCLSCGLHADLGEPPLEAERLPVRGPPRRYGLGAALTRERSVAALPLIGRLPPMLSALFEKRDLVLPDPGADPTAHDHSLAPTWAYLGFSKTAPHCHLWGCVASETCQMRATYMCRAVVEYGDRGRCACDLECAII